MHRRVPPCATASNLPAAALILLLAAAASLADGDATDATVPLPPDAPPMPLGSGGDSDAAAQTRDFYFLAQEDYNATTDPRLNATYPHPPPLRQNQGHELNGVVVGVCVTAAACCLIIATVVAELHLKRKRKKEQGEDGGADGDDSSGSSSVSGELRSPRSPSEGRSVFGSVRVSEPASPASPPANPIDQTFAVPKPAASAVPAPAAAAPGATPPTTGSSTSSAAVDKALLGKAAAAQQQQKRGSDGASAVPAAGSLKGSRARSPKGSRKVNLVVQT